MANKVFANGREISCKAASGKSIAAFPDVCFTPPLTPATPPGVPIPYPNTGMASDATDGSSSVQISSKEVMLKNKSCFSKSSGDEAGSAPKKGVVTSKNMGKVYFNAWSMDVKVEGQNVVRHLDLTTHNHAGSMPGNTPPMAYMDGMAPGAGGGEPDCGCPATPSTGSPVNPVLGVKVLAGEEDLDFVLPGPMALRWQRHYFSSNLASGWFGQGWSTLFETHLELSADGGIDFVDEFGRRVAFPFLPREGKFFSLHEKTTLLRDAQGDFGLHRPDGTAHWYQPTSDTSFVLARIVDRNGNMIRLERDESQRRIVVHCSGGQRLELRFGQTHRLIEIVEWRKTASVTLARYAYGVDGQLTAVVDRGGLQTRQFEYSDRLLCCHRFGDFEARYEYAVTDGQARVVKHWNNVGQRWIFEYGERDNRVTDQDGRTTVYHLDAKRRWVGTTDAAGQRSGRCLDAYGNLRATVDPAGQVQESNFDERGNPALLTDAKGAKTEIVWHEQFNVPVVVTDATGATQHFAYDERCNLVQQIDGLGIATSFQVDERGLPVVVIDGKGGEKKLTYNEAGQPTSYTDCSGKRSEIAYDENGWVVLRRDPSGGETHYEYDASGRLVRRRGPTGTIEAFHYDRASRLIAFVDGNGHRTRFELAPDGLILARIDPTGGVVRYRYDGARNLVELVNENGASHRQSFDAIGRLIRQETFDGRVFVFHYNESGDLVEQLEQPGTGAEIRTLYERDPLGKLLRRQTGDTRQEFEYDGLGRIVTATNQYAVVSLKYDETGQVVAEQRSDRDQSFITKYGYDELGNRSFIELPDGQRLNFLYYGSGHLHQINLDGVPITDIERDDSHREVLRTQGAIQTQFVYDAMDRLVQQAVSTCGPVVGAAPAGVAIRRSYTYDAVAQLLQREDWKAPATYEYDPLSRLRRANDERFDFDPAHNLLPGASGAGTATQARIADDRLTQFADKRCRHDPHGRVIQKRQGDGRTLALSWDDDHQLVQCRRDAGAHSETVRYGYDAFGRRIAKVTSKQTTLFVWDGDRLLQERCGRSVRTYVYLPGSYLPLAQIESELPSGGSSAAAATPVRTLYYHCDHIGLPRELSDGEGNIIWRADYRAHGELATPAPADAAVQPLRFQGQYFDEETGLHYNRFRYYDPSIGRYLSPDPIGLRGGMNAYAYGKNPIMWIDPLGLCGKCAIVIGETQDRVDAYAKAQQGKMGYSLYTVRDPVLPGFRWGAAGFFRGADGLPRSPETEDEWQKALKENEKFMNQAQEKGCKVVDIGRDPALEAKGKPVSRYYELERNMSNNFGSSNVTRVNAPYVARILGGG